jgi:hypothetical protein
MQGKTFLNLPCPPAVCSTMRISAALALAILVAAGPARAGEASLPLSWGALAIESAVPREEARKSYAIPAAEIFAFDFLLNQFDRRHFGCCDFDSNASTIRRNLRSSWVVDRDPFLVNQLGHPYQGSMYHGFARSAGLGYWESLGYTFAASAMWEVAGETTPPSRNDQINTGIGGSFLGEALFRMAHLVLEREGEMSPFLREIAAAAISPPVGFNRLAFGERLGRFSSGDPLYFTRLEVGFSGTAHNDAGFSTTKLRRDEALVDFFMDYGLPGKGDYEYRRPFDYFTFQATASSANGFENAMTRGLLLGKEYDGQRYRGVWGLYGIYDYFAPQTFRVSSTAAALGTTAQWWATDSVAVIGTGLAGLGYTAAGSTRPTDDREFHYGVAPQATLALRVIFRERAAIDFTARQYYVSRISAAQRGGHENITRVDLGITFRVTGRHGVTIKYLGNRRDASFPDLGDRSQHRGTVGIFYTYLGHQLFGAAELK